MSAKNGAIVTAIGRKYLDLAFHAAESLRQTNPALEVDLFTDAAVPPGAFSRVQVLHEIWVRSKLDAMILSRFDKTLALDADLMVLADLGDIFDVLDRFDIAIAHDQLRNSIHARREYRLALPNAFPQMNAGVMGFRRSPQVQAFLQAWRTAVRDHAIGKDQPSLRELLWQSDLRVAVLPPEYNMWDLGLLDHMVPKHHAAPRIIHSNLFVQKPRPPTGADALSHYLGPARALKVQIMLAADSTLAPQGGRMPSFWQRQKLKRLYVLDWLRKQGRRAIGPR
jgi:hypothetical protein